VKEKATMKRPIATRSFIPDRMIDSADCSIR
jgi:hypothetical protein